MPQISRRAMLYGTAAAIGVAPTLVSGQGARPGANGAGAAALKDTEWHHYAGTLNSNRYSPLDQISAANFNNLQVAWRLDTSHFGPRPEFSFEGTPLLIKGRLYTTAGTRRSVVALDAATGEIKWVHGEDEGVRGQNAPRQLSGRGLSYWTDGTRERIIYVTPGYRLLSLDIATGLPDPEFGVNGVVDLKLNDDQDIDLLAGDIGLHSTPLVASNVIVVGAAHRDSSVPRKVKNTVGYVRGFDARTGKRLWIFHTIPRKGEVGYDSWLKAGQAEATGNAGSWAEMSADEELGLVYFGVEMPTGDYTGIYRQGRGLFGESLVAVDIKTGKLNWYYQMVHHGLWDRDVPCAAILCDIPVNGKMVKAIAQPTKQCFTYVLDRTNGKPIWPIPEKPVPAGNVPGEWYSPTQPFPSKPPAFDRQSINDDDLIDFTPAIKAKAKEIASHYVRIHGIYDPPTIATNNGTWGTLMAPGSQGGINWPGGSYDPETHIAYIYSKTNLQVAGIIANPDTNSDFGYVHGQEGAPFGAGRGAPPGGEDGPAPAGPPAAGRGGRGGRGATDLTLDGPIRPGQLTVAGLPLVKPPYGRVTALDLKDGTKAWQVAHGETPDLIKNHPLLKGITIPRTGQAANVGPLVTKTLVIIGDGGVFTDERGRTAARLRAYDKATGEEKGAVFMDAQQSGVPMTYALGGWQYIVLAISGAGVNGSQLVAYRLPQV